MYKVFFQSATLLGALSVALGAFGSHALKKMAPAETIAIFETGVRYQFYHVFALIAVAFLYKDFPNQYVYWSGCLFISGIVFFSGSLYLLTYKQIAGADYLAWVGPITPLGGLQLIIAWILFLLGVAKN